MELPFVFRFHQVSFTIHTPRRQQLSLLQRDRLGGLIINNDDVSKGVIITMMVESLRMRDDTWSPQL